MPGAIRGRLHRRDGAQGGVDRRSEKSAFDSFNSWIQARLEKSVYKTARNYYASPSGRIVTQWPFSVTRFWWISRIARRSVNDDRLMADI